MAFFYLVLEVGPARFARCCMALNPAMLDVLDRDAVIDCIADEYARQERDAQRQKEESAFMVYVTDMLREVAENTGRFIGKTYARLPRLVDAVEKKPEDNRTAEEIAADVIKRAGLTLVHSEG